MTLGDLIRRYLEDRRKACELKARCLDLCSSNFQIYNDHDQDDNVITLSNDHYFSNTLDPKPNKPRSPNRQTFASSVSVKKIGRVITLPDGSKTMQVETVVTDGKGNEEKTVYYHKNGKKYTTITRRNASGEETVEENVGDSTNFDVFPFDPFGNTPFSRSSGQNLDSGYDYWYNKLFKSQDRKTDDEMSNGITIVDPNTNMDDHIEKMLRRFGFGGFFGPFPSIPRTKSRDTDVDLDDNISTEFDESSLNDNIRSMFEEMEPKKGSKRIQKQMEEIFKSVTPPETPSVFDKFAEDAYAVVPDEKTPLDKFIEPDEEQISRLKPIRQQGLSLLEKLEKYFNGKQDDSLKGDIYSDIEDPKALQQFLELPQHNSELPAPSTFFDMLRKSPSSGVQISGAARIESIRRSADGNIQKDVSYTIGNQTYKIKTVTTPSGIEIKREKSLNFPESELSKFKQRWGNQFPSDFADK